MGALVYYSANPALRPRQVSVVGKCFYYGSWTGILPVYSKMPVQLSLRRVRRAMLRSSDQGGRYGASLLPLAIMADFACKSLSIPYLSMNHALLSEVAGSMPTHWAFRIETRIQMN
jgi:hypothetical protein